MTESQTRRRLSKRYTRPEMRPFVTALGQLALAWNDLQEMLAIIFSCLAETKDWNVALCAWYAIKSDRAQRQMLLAVVNELSERLVEPSKDEWEGIKWLIKEAEKLEDRRNDAIHSPLVFIGDSPLWARAKIAIPGVKPATFLGNPRAAKLDKKADLLAEFRWCRDMATTLADYAHLLEIALSDAQKPWPDKPKLPNRGRQSSRPSRPR